jgi:DNA-binding MarR family transcriptional regulator
VDGLERHALLVRKRVATDRRGVRLEPTEAGLEAIDRAESALNGRIGALINPEHAATANEIAAAVSDNLDRAAS